MPRLFGTDGIRSIANQWPLSADFVLKLGWAAGKVLAEEGGAGEQKILIGKDTRLSGYMFENALTAGFTSTGMNVLLLGPVPTPAVGLLTPSMRADVGVMISASHNPYQDNGLKAFGRNGIRVKSDPLFPANLADPGDVDGLLRRRLALPVAARWRLHVVLRLVLRSAASVPADLGRTDRRSGIGRLV